MERKQGVKKITTPTRKRGIAWERTPPRADAFGLGLGKQFQDGSLVVLNTINTLIAIKNLLRSSQRCIFSLPQALKSGFRFR